MKKTYIRPASDRIDLYMEDSVMTTASYAKADDTETMGASNALSNKKNNMWDTDEWAQTNW